MLVASGALAFAIGPGATEGFFEVVWITALQERVTPTALAGVSSYDVLGSFLFLPLGFALAGPAADAFGLREVLFACAGFAVVSSAAVAALPSVRGFRRLEDPGYNVV